MGNMGFNSTVLVLNDRISEIEADPEGFVREMVRGIMRRSGHYSKMEDFYPGQSTVMSCAHTDVTTILAVGGNYATVLGGVFNGGVHHTPEAQEKLLRQLADQHGFRLVRKPTKKETK